MTVARDDLVAELKTLRKGRGMGAAALTERIGPGLREVFGIDPAADGASLRQAVARRLRELSESLPQDLRICVVAAFGLQKDVDLPFYQDRVRWAAEQLQRDDRTVRRRIDEGIRQLAELALAPAVAGPVEDGDGGWRTESLRSILSLDRPTPELIEFRRVAAERDGLGEVDLAWTMSKVELPEDLPVEVLYGGTLVSRQLEAADRIGLMLRLATPLRRGEVVEVALRYRAPSEQMRPHYVCTPLHPCDHFELRVRFPSDRPPNYVWLLDGVLQGDIEDKVAPRDLVRIDEAGEVMVEFRRLKPSRSYGIRWE
ncbi:hypothetical protein [Labedaea rhizosphaerae]|uniref:Uncharacterized protein n=1 Tax=Labedaea rhizosphaerae TaxID=598644 RepID=A0A4R6SBT8_LABRH|nr:hypothetical protein [Labedaea rhizosphaerae]TDP96355.1 hypothetical protein EV186_104340 [Labedaea rhizosphaerae]